LLSETYNTVSIRETIDNVPKIFIPVTTNSYTKSWDLDGTYKGIEMVKQDLWNVDEYGNLKMKEVLSDEYKTIPDEFNWKWQSQYWTFFDHVTDNGKWHSRLMGTVVKAKSYELDEWKFESTENKYYGNGLLEFIKSIAGYDQFSSPLVSKTNLEYDIYGNITKKTLSAPNDTQLPNRVTDYEYSSIYNGRFLTKQTVIGPPDVSTVYEYYADKGMLKEKKELYNASTNTSPIVTKYEYDSFGRLQKTTHPDQTMSFTEMTFAGTSGGEIPAGAVVKIKTYTKTLNNQTWATATRYLDKYGNQLRSIGQNLQGTNIYVDKTYDNYGRLVNETDPYYAGNPTSLTTTYAYDELGRVSTLTASNGTIMKTTYKGRAVKIKNMTSKVWTEKTINAIGLVDLIVDTLKTLNSADGINNNYDGLGRLINTVAFGNTSSFEYDAAGNQSKLIDPNAGTIIYSYNAYGELVTQKDARNNEYKMVYDKLGRIVSKILISVGSDSTTYTYLDNPSANGFTQLSSVSRNNGTMVSFTYDKLGRILKKNETVDQIIFTFAYTYNSNTGMLETYEYPSGYKLKYLYDSRGNQHEVRTGDAANTLLWKANSENQRGQLLQATLGNGAITDYGWDTYGYPQMNKVSKGSTILQNLTFSFNSVTGNLNTRTDVKRNILETFDYDNLLKNRLIYWSATGGTAKTMAYKANGNIEKKTDVSRALDGYKYESTKPHAVTKVVYPTTDFSSASNLQAIEYTAFNKVESIHQAITTPFSGAYDLSLTYNPNNERVKTVLLTQLGMKTPLNTTKHFLDNYEVEQMLPSTQKQLHYLHAGDGLFAIMVKQGSNETLYYIHKDYLGSITAISNSTGSLVESLSYDPWGRRRNPANYSDYNVTSTMFDRGYTGHEHLPQFGLINMNGRVYDPFLARFLSPDPFVQAPDYSQNYNRYSYAFNNPLKYTDPDGEWVHLVVGAIIGGVANWAMNGAEFNAKGLGFFGVGAVAGALAAGTGAGFGTLAAGSGSFGFMSATGLSTVGFGAGFASGAGAGLTSGLVTGTGNSLLLGNGFQQSLQNGVETGLWSSLGGGLLGGSLSGIRALSGGKDFLSGNGSGGKFGKIPSPSTVGINDKGFQSSLNSNGLRNQIDNLIEPELKSGIYGRVQGISEIRINAGLSEARALGIAGEEAVGVGAKIRIPSLTGTAKYRIPDILTSTTLGEVKNVGHQNLTRQLTDFHLYSQQTGRQFILYTRPNTTFSGPLQNLINNRIIINQSIPFR
jgi:RHS repeat-associated protein